MFQSSIAITADVSSLGAFAFAFAVLIDNYIEYMSRNSFSWVLIRFRREHHQLCQGRTACASLHAGERSRGLPSVAHRLSHPGVSKY
jgi:hypothetical protein